MTGGAVVFTVLYGFTVVKDFDRLATPEKSSGVCMGYSLDTGEILRGSSRKSQQVSSCVWLNMWEIPTGGGIDCT